MTTIVSAIYGGVDVIHPQIEQDIDVNWLMFTDDPTLEPIAPWRVIVEPRAGHPCMAAKWFKLFPPVKGDVIWIDGSMQVTNRRFARQALAARHDGLAIHSHPRRDCIYAEADASIGAESQGGKYAGLPIMEQVDSYRSEHPEHGGLYACGTVAWDMNTTEELREAWWSEMTRWTFQDQLSLPVVCRRLGVKPGIFPVRQIERRRLRWLENQWLLIHEHQSLSRSRRVASTGSGHASTS